MRRGLSDQIRDVAKEKYVEPAKRSGQTEFSIAVREMLNLLERDGFPNNHTPQICSSLKTSKFLHQNGLEIIRVDGPPSGQSPTVVVSYRIVNHAAGESFSKVKDKETSDRRATRLISELKGLLKKEIAAYGGTEAFVQWIRSDDEENA